MAKKSKKRSRKSHARNRCKFKPFRILRVLRGLMFGDRIPTNAKQWASYGDKVMCGLESGLKQDFTKATITGTRK